MYEFQIMIVMEYGISLHLRVQLRSIISEKLIFPIINLCKLIFVNKTNSDNSRNLGCGVREESSYFLSTISNKIIVKSFFHLGNIHILVFYYSICIQP